VKSLAGHAKGRASFGDQRRFKMKKLTQKQVMAQFFKDCKKLEKEGLPEEVKFGMRHFRMPHPCGTVACGAGTLDLRFGRDYFGESPYQIGNFAISHFLFSALWNFIDNTFDGFLARAKYLYKEKEVPEYDFKKWHKLYTTPTGRIKKKYRTWK
jgi:hypothetical protein